MNIFLSNNIKINIESIGDRNSNAKNVPVIFLHGFSGSSNEWLPLLKRLPEEIYSLAIDLIGHGKSCCPEEKECYSSMSIVHQLDEIFSQLNLKKVILVGYSMGGRAALSYSVAYPEKVKCLVLESATPGIIDESEREERIRSDERLAQFILDHKMEEFVDYWMNIPLFASQKRLTSEELRNQKERKLNNSPIGLANSLRGFSTGKMPQLWTRLADINFRTLLITGILDKKFTQINARIAKEIKHSDHIIVKGAGHNIHLERPEVFLNLLVEFFKKIQ
ncbi:MAG: 2-succinyl-6-hydroxy-2,4-cyclohexadiene-1-carboxylate synthase [Bacteroidota bacterium]|nr:2-succinyl-6-hydroxy-2,4-cyclohexadiene-1-carboxylate synthase [Bacteroidota bacterium]MDP4192515.1 2-succinyl-6-hydroxy-2,4-cyclohexadiene-1-carboxylate synthase [Bacteroidota bacterium]MDP4194769.1 2-succinyl-6-hydroxy-2,4-cyclohexadiene-1-carboxylate synthase [Bacteroidota bacterium]